MTSAILQDLESHDRKEDQKVLVSRVMIEQKKDRQQKKITGVRMGRKETSEAGQQLRNAAHVLRGRRFHPGTRRRERPIPVFLREISVIRPGHLPT